VSSVSDRLAGKGMGKIHSSSINVACFQQIKCITSFIYLWEGESWHKPSFIVLLDNQYAHLSLLIINFRYKTGTNVINLPLHAIHNLERLKIYFEAVKRV
jgi:hypothetical protein